jgi:hypothetical protein
MFGLIGGKIIVFSPQCTNQVWGSPWIPEDFSRQMKQLDHETNHSPSANTKIRNVCVLYLHCPICLSGVVILEFKI